MHIGFYTNAYYPTVSGVVRSVSTFRMALTEMGHNVFVFAPHSGDFVDREPFIFRYPAVDIPQYPQIPFVIPISACLDRILPSLNLEVIHSHHPILLGQTAVEKATHMKLPMVFTFHTRYREYSHYLAINQKFVKDQIDRWLRDYMVRCHHIIAPSESIRDLLASEYGITSQVSVLPTGIDLKSFENLNREQLRQRFGWETNRILISVGRLAKEKNWDTLLEAVAPLMHRYADVRLIILGEGPERKELFELASKLNIAAQVNLVGEIHPTEVCQYLTAADIFCFASVTETQGLVTMEAMAAGLPVAAVDATGTGDAVEQDRQGFLTENNSAALTTALEQLVQDQDLRLRFGQAARQRAKTFSIRNLTRKLLEIYALAGEEAKGGRFVHCEISAR
jgi:1,2-diacylglycerol 3-alpha-glucosyltransferase